jgi:hypothetical protein
MNPGLWTVAKNLFNRLLMKIKNKRNVKIIKYVKSVNDMENDVSEDRGW